MTKKLLLVDESSTLHSIVTSSLRADDYLIMTVNSGRAAVEMLKTEHFDVIISDTTVIDMDDHGLIARLAKIKGDPSVIFIDHYADESLTTAREHAVALSVNVLGVLTSPLAPKDLQDILQNVAATRRIGDRAPETILSETEFMRGLMTDGLAAVYQPRLDLRSGTICAAGACARWAVANGGFLGAGPIIRVAQEKGLMDLLTFRMLELATAQIADWKQQGLLMPVSVNIAADNLQKDDFVDIVQDLIAQYDLDPQLLCLEVNEGDLEDAGNMGLKTLLLLKKQGFTLCLDDFGSAFTSLMKLDQIPFDELIIDRSFTVHAEKKSTAKHVLESAINLARKLKLRCSCEGVESETQLAMVRKLGADIVHGYHIGRPMHGDDFLMWCEDFKGVNP